MEVYKTLIKQRCIPVVQNMKQLESFLKTDLQICLLQDIHISLTGNMIAILHKHSKKGFVHIDMIHGISSDEYGVEFICQKFNADGIISTKSKVVNAAKKNKTFSILRVFLVDSKSIQNGINTISKTNADAIELLPAIAYNIIPYLKEEIDIPLIGGGLLKSIDDIQQGLECGFEALSLSNLDLCVQFYNIN